MWPVWTAIGATVAGAVLWTVGGVKAMQEKDNYELVREGGDNCRPKGSTDQTGTACNYSWHHMGTAGAIITGVAAGAGLLYYLIWGRSSSEIKRVPVTAAKRPSPTAVQ
jgi:hypothetical protein